MYSYTYYIPYPQQFARFLRQHMYTSLFDLLWALLKMWLNKVNLRNLENTSLEVYITSNDISISRWIAVMPIMHKEGLKLRPIFIEVFYILWKINCLITSDRHCTYWFADVTPAAADPMFSISDTDISIWYWILRYSDTKKFILMLPLSCEAVLWSEQPKNHFRGHFSLRLTKLEM